MGKSAVNPAEYLERAELIHSVQKVNEAIAKLATQLNNDYAGESPLVLCVMGGGVIFTGQLVPQLSFQLTLDYVHASRYQGETAGGELHWKVRPSQAIKGKRILILDDILDEGLTLKAIVQECLKMGAEDVKTVVLANKTLPYDKPILADYIGFEVPNRYVFGCGMDVYGWWRNLPAIYALPE
jgi:hypoxanthine phosphoribosyltransferase